MRIIFVGPSLYGKRPEPLEDELWLPPAAQGDVLRATLKHCPSQIVLIDGTYYQTLSVWHKEIVFALLEGVTMIGASSIGAIRAAELCRYGMIGIGEIFDRYKDGEEDDSLVVLNYDPESFRPLTTPRVGNEAKARDALAAIDFARTNPTLKVCTSLDKKAITPYLSVVIDRILEE
jgi:hypothetical protein